MLNRNQIIAVELADRRHVRAKKIYIDMINNLHAGIVLSEIVYWHTPSKTTGKSRLRKIDGQPDEWLACHRKGWWDRCRLTPREFDRALEKLISANLVIRDHFQYRHQKTLHVRINWPVFIPLYNKLLESSESKPTKRRIVLRGLPALWDAILSVLAELPGIQQPLEVSPIGNTPSPSGNTLSPIGDTESPRGDTYTIIDTTIDTEPEKPKESFAASAALDSQIQENSVPTAFEDAIEELDMADTPAPQKDWIGVDDPDFETKPQLQECTPKDIAAMLHAYYTWCPSDKLPTKRGKVIEFGKGIVNVPANREFAENQFQRGMVPSDYIQFLSNLRHFLKVETEDRYERMARNLNVEEPLAFKWLKNLERQKELPFCFIAPIVEEWVANGREYYTDEYPRVVHRSPDVTPRIVLGDDERDNPDLVVDVPPRYISPHAVAGLDDDDDDDDFDSDTLIEPDEMDDWTPEDWAKAGMPL